VASGTVPDEEQGRSPPGVDWRLPLLIALSAVLLAAVLLALAALSIRQGDKQVVEAEASRITDAVNQRLGAALTLVQGTRGLFAAVGQPDITQFGAYVGELNLRRRYPGVQGLGFSRFVPPPAGREAPEAQAQPQGEREAPGGSDEARTVTSEIVLLEPRDERNLAAIGFDMFAEATRREAMAASRDAGRLAASRKVVLVQEIDEDKQNGILLYAPVYGAGSTSPSHAFMGWVYAPLRVGDLLRGVRSGSPLVAFEAYDGPQPSADDLLYRSSDWPSDAAFSTTTTVTVADRTWLLVFRSLPTLESRSQMRLVPWIGLLSVLAAALLGWIAWLQARTAAAAREADRRKTEFLATLAHELRNPLAPVRNALEILHRSPPPELGARMRDVMDRQLRHMTRLIDDLLDVARVSRGKIQLQLSTTDLREATDAAAEACLPLLRARSQAFRYDRPAEAVPVQMDATRIAQVLTNLLRNASSYTPEGGHVELSIASSAAEVRVVVKDDGMGIAPEHLPAVFEMFAQLPGQGAHGGLGIGLSLSSSLARLHGGRIEAASEGAGRGATFTLVLPAFAPAQA
jgi:signal transduction histidine kinase